MADTQVIRQWAAGPVKEGTIGYSGCALTSSSMIIYSTGTYSQPDVLNDEMLHPYGPMPKATYYFGNLVDFDAIKDFSNGAISSVEETDDRNGIKSELDKCNFVLAQVQTSDGGCYHWTYVESYDGNNYTVHDPLRGIVTRTIGDFCGQVWVGRIHP